MTDPHCPNAEPHDFAKQDRIDDEAEDKYLAQLEAIRKHCDEVRKSLYYVRVTVDEFEGLEELNEQQHMAAQLYDEESE